MSSAESYDEKSDVKSAADIVTAEAAHHLAFKTDAVDTGAQLVAGEQIELDPAEATRIRKKIDWHILPLMCSMYFIHVSRSETHVCSSSLLGTIHGQDYAWKFRYIGHSVGS